MTNDTIKGQCGMYKESLIFVRLEDMEEMLENHGMEDHRTKKLRSLVCILLSLGSNLKCGDRVFI